MHIRFDVTRLKIDVPDFDEPEPIYQDSQYKPLVVEPVTPPEKINYDRAWPKAVSTPPLIPEIKAIKYSTGLRRIRVKSHRHIRKKIFPDSTGHDTI